MTVQSQLPIVFLPGTLCDERLWAEQIKKFSSDTVTQFIELRVQNSLQKMLQAIDATPFDQFILCGFSMGGYIAQEYVVQYPSRVSHLVLVSVSGEGLTATEIQSRLHVKALLEKGYSQKISENQIRSYLHHDSYAKYASLIRTMLNANTPEMYLNQINATLHRRNLTQEIAKTKIPVTLVGGAQDNHIPSEHFINFSRLIPQSKLYIIENCGHFIPIEKSDDMTDILRKTMLAHNRI